VFKRGHHLYLNLIDPPQPLFMMDSFSEFLVFADREIAERHVLIHCNQGESRAPSLTVLYLAKRLGMLPNDSYSSAASEFRAKFPYNPGRGIMTWLTTNWGKII
jgi:protein-tyrosine phosphatase